MTNELAVLQQAKEKIVQMSIEFGPKVVTAILILVAGFFVARWVVGVVSRWLSRLEMEPPVRDLLLRVLWVVVMGLFAVMALQNLGVQLLPLIAGLGVAGAGIALAMQGVLGNLAAGLTIIFTKPFRVGEYVSIVGVEGRVEAIQLFSTKLSHTDLSLVVIPNRKIVGEIMHNYGRIRQLNVTVGVAYNTDLNAALAVVADVLQQNPRVLKEPAPVIRVVTLADSSINIQVGPWVNVPDYIAAGGEVNKAIVEAFRMRSIAIPFPQREVRLLNPAA
ncbi:MAG TPA: mechanosensitive ion channel family protein [Verrucomicrobiae bacterium]|nr:mechanosensitive ion channel family protein [Verrucomicrobiae bacterium]